MARAWLLVVVVAALAATPGAQESGESARGVAYFGWSLECRDATDEAPGVVVAAVAPGSPAAVAGVSADDRLTSVDGLPVDAEAPRALDDLMARLVRLRTGTRILVSFQRGKHEHTVAMDVKTASGVLGELAHDQSSDADRIALLDDVMDTTAGLEDGSLFAILEDEQAGIPLRQRVLEHLAETYDRGVLDRLRETRVPDELRQAWGQAVFTAEQRLEFEAGVTEIRRALSWIRERYVDREGVGMGVLTDAAIRGMLESLDPYSDYLDEREMRETRNNRYEGIGITLESWENRHYVHWVFPEGPARDHLDPGDEILSVGGEQSFDRPREEVVQQIRGKIGESVHLTIRRRGVEDPLDVEIVRGGIQKDVVTHRDLPGGIGYLRLHTFAQDAHKEVTLALRTLLAGGARSLVLDLRGNRGGSVDEVQRIASLFLPRGTVVAYSQGRGKFFPHRELKTRRAPLHWEAPIVALVDGRSASAAEMLSGALQVAERARLVGERTYGKGVGQSTFQVDGVGGLRYLKLTTFRYYFANDVSIHEVGVEPDLVVEPEPVVPDVEDELLRLRATGEMYRYTAENLAGDDHALLMTATFFGPGTPTDRDERYPGFEAWYGSLDTWLTREQTEEGLRQFLRLEAEHELVHGHFVCDLEHDRQLQAAIEEVAKLAELDLAAEPTYGHFVSAAPAPEPAPAPGELVPTGAAGTER